MTGPRVSPDELRRLIAGALVRSATSPENAAIVADYLVAAELAGQPGHGLRRVAAYAAQAASGKVAGAAQPAIARTRPGVLTIDAGNGFAYPALRAALDPLSGLARDQGVAFAAICRSHHCGVGGVIVEQYAERGLVAMLFANTPAAIAPWGGRRPLYGTNPVAFAAPLPNEEPVVVDVSLSRVARGKIMTAHQKREAIPEDWAFDAQGRPTTDPSAALAGTMAPMGDAKGTALALMVEMLAAGLTGANFAYEASSFFEADGPPPGVGQLIIAIDPGAATPEALEHMAALAGTVSETAGARLPGRRRQDLRRDYAGNGIPVAPDLLREIEAIGR